MKIVSIYIKESNAITAAMLILRKNNIFIQTFNKPFIFNTKYNIIQNSVP